MFKTVSNALDALSKDPETANKALAALGGAIAESSEHYSALPNREKGHLIGHVLFNLFNPEGSPEAAEAGLKIANTVAMHVDKAVVQAVGQQIRAIEEIAKTAPEHAQQAKQMLYEYLKGKGLTGSELQYAGVPKGYFDGVEAGVRGDHFNAMVKPGDFGGEGFERIPEPKSLSNIESRDWYNAQLAKIDTVEQRMRKEGKSSEEIFEQTTQLRNEAKQIARDIMKDRARAAMLDKFFPIPTKEEVLARYGGDYEKGIAASKRSNPTVNEQIEQERRAQEGRE
jgi:hypothetical protein